MRFLILFLILGVPLGAARVTFQFSGLMEDGFSQAGNGGTLPTWDDWEWPGPTPLEGSFSYEREAYNRPATDPAPAGLATMGPVAFNRVASIRFNPPGWLEQFTLLAEGVTCNSQHGPGECGLLVDTRYFRGPSGPPVWRAKTQTRPFGRHNVVTGYNTGTRNAPLALDPQPVPEPGTLVLMSLGLLGLGLKARRR